MATPEAHPSLAGFPGAANWFLAHCSLPRVPASPQIPTRLIPGPERSYGSFSRFRRCQVGGVSDHTATFTPKVNRPIERIEMRIIPSLWGANKAERKRRRRVRKAKFGRTCWAFKVLPLTVRQRHWRIFAVKSPPWLVPDSDQAQDRALCQ
jgi:hypothetical protein